MFISWGRQSVTRTFGEPVNRYCPICEKERTFRQIVTYRVRHVLWIFRWITGKKYSLVCDICRRGEPLNVAEVESQRRKHIIPFIDRWGWAVGLAAVAMLIGWGIWTEQNQRKQDLAYLANPTVNDIYEINLAQMVRPPKTDQEYSLMRVTAVSVDAVQVRLSQRYCNKFGCASGDLTSGKARIDDYYGPELYTLSRGDLAKMRDDGRITAVDR